MIYLGFTLNSLTFTNLGRYEFQPQDLQGITALVGVLILFLFYVFPYSGSLPLTISHYLWNVLVYIIPSRIIIAFDAANKDSKISHSSTYPNLYAKKQAMRRIIGVDKGSLDSILPRGRRLSSLGNVLLGSRELIPPGLGNWDNSCYQNSVIQGLASLPTFADYLDRNIHSLETRGSLSTHHALRDIIERLNDPGSHGQKLWIPPELKSMSSWQQQDAQEYFSKIADQLDREVREASQKFTTNSGLRMPSQGQNSLEGQSIRDDKLVGQSAGRPNLMRNPLEGLLAQRVGCIRCGWVEGLSLIPFNCLTVSLGRKKEYDIQECLDDYMALETIEGVECAKCTLLRAQDQLKHLIQQIDEDVDLTRGPQLATVSSTLKKSAQARLQAVQEALDEEDFTEKALTQRCHIPSKNRVSATKSRQAVIARAPSNLVIHVNRSVFDEETGTLRKNHADVRFPSSMDLGDWCLGTRNPDGDIDSPEIWDIDPQASMLPLAGEMNGDCRQRYELRAVLTHFGRHENGHYVCFRKFSFRDFPSGESGDMDGEKKLDERWFRLSDEDVRLVSEQTVFDQGGVFMLFYERVDEGQSNFPGGNDRLLEDDLNTENQQTISFEHRTQLSLNQASSETSNTSLNETEVSSAESTSFRSGTSDSSLDPEHPSGCLSQTSLNTAHISHEHENVHHREFSNGHMITA